ncbi:NAD-binding protein [Pseudonocardia charpentierae]|uniref:NAD-binding protein n=1 Tax=Pseudonocardia charpentierae TaxID=3075545 RepID=A0ABU2ND24_9PSEU|nr:NAD-binding protein [Pseudonocardia sp. DSM 45834]MDT0351843.1 NAD-binding protein [Pseudonocardia sp. DSM 45834]
MGNPLLVFWVRLLTGEEQGQRRTRRWRVPMASATQASATIFLVMRRMRTPLIVLIAIFAVGTLGLTLIDGQDAQGRPWRMGFFDAFYVMSYTASTIGFGEIPYAFTYNQRMWVTISIYLTVVGWAYAIGSLLALVQERSFRQALALQHFTRKVRRLGEPFLLIAGYGQTGELLARSLDALGRRFVVIDSDSGRIDDLYLASYHADVPGLVADAGDPGHLAIAGLGHPYCEGVLAITDNDEANLAATQAAALLRPDLPVITRTVSPVMEARMQVFGSPTVVNPFDRFGDHLRLALRAPASFQLLTWLESGPGEPLPKRGDPPSGGHWIVCGYGRFGKEVTHDLRAEGYDVTIVEPGDAAENDPDAIVGRGYEPHVLTAVDVERAAGFVAGTDNDTTNLSLVAAAHRANPRMFIAARQNRPSSASLFAAVDLDALLVPAEVVAHEVYAQLSTPLLWRFLREMPAKGDEWADSVVGKLTNLCGKHLQSLWKVRLSAVEAPALRGVLESERVPLGDLLRSPDDREERLHTVVLLVARGDEAHLAPSDDFAVTLDDELLLVGEPAARRLLDSTLLIDATREYVLHNRHVPSSWIWRKLTRRTAGSPDRLP